MCLLLIRLDSSSLLQISKVNEEDEELLNMAANANRKGKADKNQQVYTGIVRMIVFSRHLNIYNSCPVLMIIFLSIMFLYLPPTI